MDANSGWGGGALIFSSTDAYGEKFLIGHISAEKKDTELQPTGIIIRHYNKSFKHQVHPYYYYV